MTPTQILHYIEVGLAFAAVMAPTVGAIGHAFAAMPWTWAKTIGNVLNAISVDFGDLKDSLKNAKQAVADPSGGTVAIADAVKTGALTPIGDDLFQAPPGSRARLESVAPKPMFPPSSVPPTKDNS